ncbi:MAG TPA: PaaI family thioesterase [Candidatus Thermoplasmatota archaeon]|nr:PaaI family thioesterase [Candidatus Thermoplasmatota archaeon]
MTQQVAPPGGGEYGRRFGLTAMRMLEDGSVELDFDVRPEHLQEFGVLHGGAVMTLLDMAMGASVMRTLAPEELTATESMVTDFMKGIRGGRVTARAWIERRGRTTAFPRGELRNEKGELVGRATGVWAIRPKG